MELSQLIGYSPKRTLVFQQCKQQLAIGGSGIRPICPTRWTVRTAAINAVLNNYPALKQVLQIIGESSYDDYGRRTSGLLALMDKYDTYFGLKLSYLIFSGTDQTSINLQMKDTSVQEALSGAELAKCYLQRMRSDNSFQQFYASVTREAEEYTEVPTLPRYRHAPRELDGGSEPHHFSSPQDYYKPQYYEAIDLVVAEISARFDQKTMLLLKEIETLIIKASNCVHNTEIAIPESILKLYSKDIDMEKAEVQLRMLPDLVKAFKQSEGLHVLTITNMRSIADILNKVPLAKDIYSEIDKLLRLYLTVPVTMCTAERSFSALRRVKTYLRSSVTEERLNNVLLLHVHREEAANRDLKEIACMFVAANERRTSFFGQFLCDHIN